MSSAFVLLLAFLIGIVSGLRSLTAPALVAWSAHQNWLDLRGSPISFLRSSTAVAIFTVLAIGELIGDKLPFTPARTEAVGLIARFILGGLSGAAVAVAGSQSLVLGAVLGAVGGIAGAFGGYQIRTRLVKALRVSDYVVALMEDAVAIGAGLLIVSRF